VSNTAVGWSTMFVATTGGANCICECTVLGSLTTENSNIAIGFGPGQNYTISESSNIVIGATSTISKSSKIQIGCMQDSAFIARIHSTITINIGAMPVLIDSARQLGTVSSFIKFKENIADITEWEVNNLDFLCPVSFNLLIVDYSRLAILLLKEVQLLKKKVG
jgi:hypothetical protein